MTALEVSKKAPTEAKDNHIDHSDNKKGNGLDALDLLKEGKDSRKPDAANADVPKLTLTDNNGKPGAKPESEKAGEKHDSKPKVEPSKHDNSSKKEAPAEKHESTKDKIVKELKHFGEGLASGIALEPINGITQLINHTFKTDIHKIEFRDQEEVDKSLAGKIGKGIGKAADLAALTVATGGVGAAVGIPADVAAVTDLAAAGALQGGVLTPTDEHKGQFWQQRFASASEGAISKAAPEGKISLAVDVEKSVRENREKEKGKEKSKEPVGPAPVLLV